MEYTHTPVLLPECLDALRIRPDGVYVDGTLGRAGHSREIAKRLNAGGQETGPQNPGQREAKRQKAGRLVCIDRDGAAIAAAEERLAPWRDRVTLVRGNFADLDALLDEAGVQGADGMLFDLGVSSPQLDDPARGFSYRTDAPLDMRMDAASPLTARDIVNGWPYEELRRILSDYGEERYAGPIARAVVRAREARSVETTLELAEIVRSAMPAKALREKQHPAKRTFQAVRIAVNGELDALEPMLRAAAKRLNPGGRLAVITFHSLEDRIVKRTLADLSRGCTSPPDFPVCVCGNRPLLRLVHRKPILPGAAEVEANPRARSAKLRTAERTETPVPAQF